MYIEQRVSHFSPNEKGIAASNYFLSELFVSSKIVKSIVAQARYRKCFSYYKLSLSLWERRGEAFILYPPPLSQSIYTVQTLKMLAANIVYYYPLKLCVL
jgi:hypothetical protein